MRPFSYKNLGGIPATRKVVNILSRYALRTKNIGPVFSAANGSLFARREFKVLVIILYLYFCQCEKRSRIAPKFQRSIHPCSKSTDS